MSYGTTTGLISTYPSSFVGASLEEEGQEPSDGGGTEDITDKSSSKQDSGKSKHDNDKDGIPDDQDTDDDNDSILDDKDTDNDGDSIPDDQDTDDDNDGIPDEDEIIPTPIPTDDNETLPIPTSSDDNGTIPADDNDTIPIPTPSDDNGTIPADDNDTIPIPTPVIGNDTSGSPSCPPVDRSRNECAYVFVKTIVICPTGFVCPTPDKFPMKAEATATADLSVDPANFPGNDDGDGTRVQMKWHSEYSNLEFKITEGGAGITPPGLTLVVSKTQGCEGVMQHKLEIHRCVLQNEYKPESDACTTTYCYYLNIKGWVKRSDCYHKPEQCPELRNSQVTVEWYYVSNQATGEKKVFSTETFTPTNAGTTFVSASPSTDHPIGYRISTKCVSTPGQLCTLLPDRFRYQSAFIFGGTGQCAKAGGSDGNIGGSQVDTCESTSAFQTTRSNVGVNFHWKCHERSC